MLIQLSNISLLRSISIRTVPFEHDIDRTNDDFYICPQRVIQYIPVIKVNPFLIIRHIRPFANLPWSCNARFHGTVEAGTVTIEGLKLAPDDRPGSNNTHITLQDINELREFIKTGF